MKQEPLSQIHLIRDTDLAAFAFELNIFAGNFMRESEFNIRSRVVNTGPDSIAIMGKNHMWLSDVLYAYCSTADLHRMIIATQYLGDRAFLFHTNRQADGRLYGDVMMLNLDMFRQDVKRNTLYPYGASIEYWDGTKAEASAEKWESMEPCEKDVLKSWRYLYDPDWVTKWQHDYSGRLGQWKEQACSFMPQ